jgi:hypothetical protein
MSNDEEEEEDLATKTRKAWYAGHQAAAPLESAGFRGVPGVPHGGSQSVRPEQTAGSMDWCWCGQPFDHDWPGKADGRRHPKESQMTSTPVETEEQPRIERRALRAYHADLADIIITAVNEYHTKYRLTAHSVILFPLDGTKPYAINARNGDRQVRGARIWFAKHCVPPDISIRDAAKKPAVSNKPVDEETVKELAEMLNSEEHLPKGDEPAKAEAQPAEQPVEPPAEPPVEEPSGESAPSEEWMPYKVNLGKHNERTHEFYVVNAAGDVKCTLDGWIGKNTGTGGHTRTHHTDTTTLWGPKAKEKGVQTYFTNKAKNQVTEAITMLQNAMGIEPPAAVDTSTLEAEVKKLKKQVEELTVERDGLKQKYSDLETKMALAREAFGL